jgi:hypothetical protein
MKTSELIVIFDQASYEYINTDHDYLDYYNYLTSVYRTIDMYKINHLNFIEYVIDKEQLISFLSTFNYSQQDIKNKPELILQVQIDNIPDNKPFLKVPEHLLKSIDNFVLPIQFISNSINEVSLFERYTLGEKAILEIKKIINQYCFFNKNLYNLKDNIVKGQNIEISPHLLSASTYLEFNYPKIFNTFLENKEEIKFENSKFDNLFFSENDNRFFCVKLLHVSFVGSFYEYRNFIFNNNSILNNILDVIYHDLKISTLTTIDVRSSIDRFVSYHSISDIYDNILNTLHEVPLCKDIDRNEIIIPDDIIDCDYSTLKMNQEYIYLSNFKDKPLQKGQKSKNIQSHKENIIDLAELKKLHDKKYPNIPFPYSQDK